MTSRGSEYDALVAKVDEAVRVVSERCAESITCHVGCESCCHVELTVSEVEARAVREGLSSLGEAQRQAIRERASSGPQVTPRCVMLESDGSCAIYESRPLVCRTQGQALRYPDDVIPVSAVFARTPRGVVTWCPLNYRDAQPAASDVLDAEQIDLTLAVINRRASADPLARVALRELAGVFFFQSL